MRATILAAARIIPVRKIDAGLEVFSNSDLELMTKDGVGKSIGKPCGGVVFDLKGGGRSGGRFVKESEMARAGESGRLAK